jgi:hypothetical protein
MAELLQRVFVQSYTADNGVLPCSDNFTSVLVRRAIENCGIKLKEALMAFLHCSSSIAVMNFVIRFPSFSLFFLSIV